MLLWQAIYMAFSDGPNAPSHPSLGGPYPGHPPIGDTVADHIAVLAAQLDVAHSLVGAH